MLKKSKISLGFDRLAPRYDLLSKLFFGRKIIRSQVDHFTQVSPISKLLVLGGGTGSFLPEFFHWHPDARVDFVDVSPGMIQQARELLADQATPRFEQVVFHHLDINQDLPALDGSYDAVLLPFVLDCLTPEQIRKVLRDLRPLLCSGAQVYLSDFNVPKSAGFQQVSYQALIQSMYLFFHLVTDIPYQNLPDFLSLFHECGYEMVDHHTDSQELLIRQVYRLRTA